MASVGSVSPAGRQLTVSPLFFSSKNWRPFFSHRYEVMTFFSCRLVTTPQLPSSDIVLSNVFRKFSRTFFIRVSSPCMMSPRPSRCSRVTSLTLLLTSALKSSSHKNYQANRQLRESTTPALLWRKKNEFGSVITLWSSSQTGLLSLATGCVNDRLL